MPDHVPTDTSPRPRGRPKEFETDRVLEQALELIWKQGYRATTTRDLEAALGLSQSSIYNAFGSKQDLLDAVLDRYETLTEQELVRPLEESPEGLASIDEFFVALGRWVTHEGRRGCMLINMMAEDGGETTAVTKRTRAYRARVRSALRDGLLRAAALGETQKAAVEDRADLLVGLVLGLNIAARGGVSEAELRGLLEAARAQIQSWRVEHN